jgi:DNA-directed RNA polymerase sigma subunit (sigma70/sigma32)
MPQKIKLYKNGCVICGDVFEVNTFGKSQSQKYCSDECRKIARRKDKTTNNSRANINIHMAHTLEEVAKEFGLTKQRISQIEQEALKKLKKTLSKRGIKSFEDFLRSA